MKITSKYHHKRSDLTSYLLLLFHFILAFAPIYYTAAFGPHIISLFIYLYLGIAFNSLLNLMHETSHNHIFIQKRPNLILGKWILGPLFFADFDAYKLRHWDHHKFLGKDGDTKFTYHINISGSNFWILILKGLFLVEVFKKLKELFKTKEGHSIDTKQQIVPLFRIVFFQFIFFLSLFTTAFLVNADLVLSIQYSIFTYLLYFYALISIVIIVSSFRAIAEHQIYTDQNSIEGVAALRNFECNYMSRLCFGNYGFGEHLTHHLHPAIPYYNLLPATIELNESDSSYHLGRGYFTTLWYLIRKPGNDET